MVTVSDVVPARLELHLASLLVSVAGFSFISYLVLTATPAAMKAYRNTVYDSLISNWLFSFCSVTLCSLYLTTYKGALHMYSGSFASFFLPAASFRMNAFLFAFSVMNVTRSNITCFKIRFEGVVSEESWRGFFSAWVYLVLGTTLYTSCLFYAMAFHFITQSDSDEVLAMSSPLFHAASYQRPSQLEISWKWVLPFAVVFVLVGAFFVLFAYGTYHALSSQLRMASTKSRATLRAQLHSFFMLLLQFLMTYPVGAAAIGMGALAALLQHPMVVILTNLVLFLVLPNYSAFYTCIVLATTKPYLVQMLKILALAPVLGRLFEFVLSTFFEIRDTPIMVHVSH